MPHHFDGITASPDRGVTLSLGGSALNLVNLSGTISSQFRQVYDLYVVEASSDLREWSPLGTVQRTNSELSPAIYRDTAPGLSQRFYRTFTNHLLTAFPPPSGPFPVGTIDRVKIDPARSGLYRYTPKTNVYLSGETLPFPTNSEIYNVLRSCLRHLEGRRGTVYEREPGTLGSGVDGFRQWPLAITSLKSPRIGTLYDALQSLQDPIL